MWVKKLVLRCAIHKAFKLRVFETITTDNRTTLECLHEAQHIHQLFSQGDSADLGTYKKQLNEVIIKNPADFYYALLVSLKKTTVPRTLWQQVRKRIYKHEIAHYKKAKKCSMLTSVYFSMYFFEDPRQRVISFIPGIIMNGVITKKEYIGVVSAPQTLSKKDTQTLTDLNSI